jgi:hypothetical protein
MESARANSGCLALAAQHERLAALELNNKLLDEIQKVAGAAARQTGRLLVVPPWLKLPC